MVVDVGRYLSDAQLATLSDRAAGLGRAAIEALRAEWVELFTKLRKHLLDGTPVDDDAVRSLVTRWEEIAAAFHPGDPHFEAATTALWQDNRSRIGDQLDQHIGWSGAGGTAEVVDYIRRARAAGDRKN
jgi:hypothetical protein